MADSEPRLIRMGAVLRYARGVTPAQPMVDGYPSYQHLAAASDGTYALLDSGTNLVSMVTAVDGIRRPAIVLRSSPWKAGKETTPWHDVFDLDHGYVRYFGDHKVTTSGALGSTRGNKALLEEWNTHLGESAEARLLAPPILLFRGVSVNGSVKGYVEFCGVAVLERIEQIAQRDPPTARSFANYAFDLAVLDLSGESEELDHRWIDDRRQRSMSAREALRAQVMAQMGGEGQLAAPAAP